MGTCAEKPYERVITLAAVASNADILIVIMTESISIKNEEKEVDITYFRVECSDVLCQARVPLCLRYSGSLLHGNEKPGESNTLVAFAANE